MPRVFADLTGTAVGLTQARSLEQHLRLAFTGDTHGGAFDIPGRLAGKWPAGGGNPNGRPNGDALQP